VDDDDLAHCRAIFAALAPEWREAIKAAVAEPALRPGIPAMLAPLGLTLEEVEKVLADD
jgi:hypothetical protein